MPVKKKRAGIPSAPTPPKLVNHIGIAVDCSGSTGLLTHDYQLQTRKLLATIKAEALATGQLTFVTVVNFAQKSLITTVIKSADATILDPDRYNHEVHGMTALRDATMNLVAQLDVFSRATKDGDNAFCIYVITDGEENDSYITQHAMRNKLASLPENWTPVIMVPTQVAKTAAIACGFAPGNIQVFETTTSAGVERGYGQTTIATQSYFANRSKGIRGSSTFYTDLSGVTKKDVKKLIPVPATQYKVYTVEKETDISTFVTYKHGGYIPGDTYYELTKPEKIQANKDILIQDRTTGEVFGDGTAIRSVLNLPSGDLKVNPGNHANWRLFVQSRSVNRKLVRGTKVLVNK
jgi:uncharacterized protein YegL